MGENAPETAPGTRTAPAPEAAAPVGRPDVPPQPGRSLLLWSLVAVVAAVLAVALGGAAPEPAPAGLPDPGPVPGWSLPLVRLVQHGAALAVVGALLAAVLARRASRARLVAGAAAVWAAASAAGLVLGLAEVVAQPVPDALTADLLRFYALEVPQGQALLRSGLLAALVLVTAPLLRDRSGTPVLLGVALLALVPPLLEGHAADESDHRLAQASLVAHVLPAVLWTGGLAALGLLRRAPELPAAAARFSPLALVCALTVGASGVLGAWLRLDTPSQLWSTGYGGLLVAKTVLLLLLVAAGARHRGRTLPRLAAGDPGAFRRLAGGEVAVMVAAFGLAVALARTPLG